MKESAPWIPSRWSPERIARFMSHVQKFALRQLNESLGPHNGGVIGAQVVAEFKAIISRAALRSRGVKLIGDE
jgi:hypothetical protein